MNFLRNLFKNVTFGEQKKFTSIVLLLSEFSPMSLDEIKEILDSAFPGNFIIKTDDSFVLDGPSENQYFVKSIIPYNSGLFLIIHKGEKYFAEDQLSKFSNQSKEIEKGIHEHNAWISVDLVTPIGSESAAYRFIGKAINSFALKQKPLILHHPESNKFTTYNDNSINALKSENVITELFHN